MATPFYASHIFCCTNRREDGAKRGSCAAKNSEALRDYMKKRVRELGLSTDAARLRVNAAGCLDRCELGPVLVIYPEGIWYRAETEADIDAILQAHYIDRKPAEHLLLTNTPREV